MKKFLAILLLIIIIVSACLVVPVYLQVDSILDNVEVQNIALSDEDLCINSGVRQNNLHREVTNIAIFGIDSRPNQDVGRSDCIMVLSLNENSSTINLVSLLRDTYVDIPGEDYNKLNAAYAFGGPELAIKTINANLDLDIQQFVTVDFNALIGVIDALGGITLNVTDEEVAPLNKVIRQHNKLFSDDTSEVEAGEQLLNGSQSLAYARIRYLGNSDFDRTARQQIVFGKIIDKLKSTLKFGEITNIPSMVGTLLDIANSVSGNIATSIKKEDMLDYVYKAYKCFDHLNTSSLTSDDYIKAATIDGAMVLLPRDLSDLAIMLRQRLYGESEYTPTDDLTQRSDELAYETSDVWTETIYTGTTL